VLEFVSKNSVRELNILFLTDGLDDEKEKTKELSKTLK
jgi:hypothetical protein